MAGKGREKIKLRSTAKNQKGKPTGTFYTTTINKSGAGSNEKLKKKKYDKRAYVPETGKTGARVEFVQDKLK